MRPLDGESLFRFFFLMKLSCSSIYRLSLLIIFDKVISAYHCYRRKDASLLSKIMKKPQEYLLDLPVTTRKDEVLLLYKENIYKDQ